MSDYPFKIPPKILVITPEREFIAELSDDLDELWMEIEVGKVTENSRLVDHAKTFDIQPEDPEYSEPFYATLIGDVILKYKTVTFTTIEP